MLISSSITSIGYTIHRNLSLGIRNNCQNRFDFVSLGNHFENHFFGFAPFFVAINLFILRFSIISTILFGLNVGKVCYEFAFMLDIVCAFNIQRQSVETRND